MKGANNENDEEGKNTGISVGFECYVYLVYSFARWSSPVWHA
jgi:hypothetical protein